MNEQRKSSATSSKACRKRLSKIWNVDREKSVSFQQQEEVERDWRSVEQKAYERIQEGNTKNISGNEFLMWLSKLERKRKV